ncbi:hypothetical protein [Salipaludibacillus sp. LMS25]|jgi:hypothetical protein|nr:hypothetical protein [Salipaludibacillus sp. LMS25]
MIEAYNWKGILLLAFMLGIVIFVAYKIIRWAFFFFKDLFGKTVN